MEKIRYAIVGTGWRAMFFVRAAKNLPELFEVTGILTRSKERAEQFEREHGVPAFTDMDEMLRTKPEFVVSCVTKAAIEKTTLALVERGMNVLSETPIATDEEGLVRVYEAVRRSGVTLQLAEQYFFYPNHAARAALVKEGLLGEVSNCWLSLIHDYHALSMMRVYLGADDRQATIRAVSDRRDIVVTGDRSGVRTDGTIGYEERVFAHIAYGDGKLGLYDFSGTQYHSEIRSNHLRIIGDRGEIFDDEVRWVPQDNRPMKAKLEYRRDVKTGTIRAIDFDGERIYENPFRCDVAMSEDDIAVCCVLRGMGEAVREGKLFYPLEECFRDGYYSYLLHEATRTGETMRAKAMPWDDHAEVTI